MSGVKTEPAVAAYGNRRRGIDVAEVWKGVLGNVARGDANRVPAEGLADGYDTLEFDLGCRRAVRLPVPYLEEIVVPCVLVPLCRPSEVLANRALGVRYVPSDLPVVDPARAVEGRPRRGPLSSAVFEMCALRYRMDPL